MRHWRTWIFDKLRNLSAGRSFIASKLNVRVQPVHLSPNDNNMDFYYLHCDALLANGSLYLFLVSILVVFSLGNISRRFYFSFTAVLGSLSFFISYWACRSLNLALFLPLSVPFSLKTCCHRRQKQKPNGVFLLLSLFLCLVSFSSSSFVLRVSMWHCLIPHLCLSSSRSPPPPNPFSFSKPLASSLFRSSHHDIVNWIWTEAGVAFYLIQYFQIVHERHHRVLVCNKMSFGEIRIAITVYRQLWKQSECITDALSCVGHESECVIRERRAQPPPPPIIIENARNFHWKRSIYAARYNQPVITAWSVQQKIDTIWYVLTSKIDFLEV